MPYDAKVILVMIASPSDVLEERKIVRDIIEEWNTICAAERSAVFVAVGWETGTSPELSGRPQQMINERLLAKADLLVGIFWTRVGSPTGKAISGSVEEIEEHMKAGKPVMLYFSNVPAKINSIDDKQYEQLKTFKKWAREKGLVESYDTQADFRDKFRRQLPLTLQDNAYLRSLTGPNTKPRRTDRRSIQGQ